MWDYGHTVDIGGTHGHTVDMGGRLDEYAKPI
jgi:hypothetical protein